MALKPLGDRIVVKALQQREQTSGGIYLPDSAKERPQEGEVVAVGEGRVLDDATIKRLEVKAGDKVLFGKYAGTEVDVDETEYLIMRESDVLAIVS